MTTDCIFRGVRAEPILWMPADLRCAVSAGTVTDEVRDELIAIAHGARHWH